MQVAHLVEEGAALSRYVADNRYATKRAPKAAAMERHLRAARLLAAADASLMVYDPFVYHRGAAAAAAKTGGRVFVMLGAADLAAADKRAMRSTNDIKRPWQVRV